MRWRYTLPAMALLAALMACTDAEPQLVIPENPVMSTVAAPPSEAEGSSGETDGEAPVVDTDPDQAPQPTVRCPEAAGWNTQPDQSPERTYTQAQVTDVRIGKHDCFDRLVVDVRNGPEVGFYASYEPVVRQPGSGFPVEVAGGAALQLIVYAPATMLAEPGHTLYSASALEAGEWQALREVRYAGFFEGQSTFAIGAAEERPFAVTTWVKEGQVTHVIVDIAH